MKGRIGGEEEVKDKENEKLRVVSDGAAGLGFTDRYLPYALKRVSFARPFWSCRAESSRPPRLRGRAHRLRVGPGEGFEPQIRSGVRNPVPVDTADLVPSVWSEPCAAAGPIPVCG